eukprot:jgi/Psemu1/62820/estExt_Genemark1.C_90139
MRSSLRSRAQPLQNAGRCLLVLVGYNWCCCHGFSVPNPEKPTTTPTTTPVTLSFPPRLEDWDHRQVEDWLRFIGFGRYSPSFASDFGGIGVDGDRLVYLGTEDQLDHIEYQLELIGVERESDQLVLGAAIIDLVAASSDDLAWDVLQSLAREIPPENREQDGDGKEDNTNSNGDDDDDDSDSDTCDKEQPDRKSSSQSMDYEI